MISMGPKAEDRLCRTVHISAPLILALRRLGIHLTPGELRQLQHKLSGQLEPADPIGARVTASTPPGDDPRTRETQLLLSLGDLSSPPNLPM
jgi:hypothetical protein